MNWKALFLTAEGRIGRKEFWIGFVTLFIVKFLVGLLPRPLDLLAGLVLVWPGICINAKRLHDLGRTGWLMLAPFLGTLFLGIAAMVVSGAGMGQDLPLIASASLGLLVLILDLGYLLWLGVGKGDVGANRFGPSPGAEPAAAQASDG